MRGRVWEFLAVVVVFTIVAHYLLALLAAYLPTIIGVCLVAGAVAIFIQWRRRW